MAHLIAAAAAVAVVTAPPECPPDPRAAEMPGMLLAYEDFTSESYERAKQFLKATLPERIVAAHARTGPKDDIWGGEIGMAHYNMMNLVEGYVLKLHYQYAPANERADRARAFCNFLARVSIVD